MFLTQRKEVSKAIEINGSHMRGRVLSIHM